MRVLHKKLLRDLWEIKGQVVAISAVIAVGVTMFITYLSTFDSLRRTQETFYERYRFADVFASLVRAPSSLQERLGELPGVAKVETRVVAEVTLDVEGMAEPITGRLVSIPEVESRILNDLALLQGRYLEPGRPDEVIVIEGFALAHELGPGDRIGAVINGRHRSLEIVGIALSPEFVYTIRPGDLMPDDARFGVLWMGRKALATAFDMEGGFNDVAVKLVPGASDEEVIRQVDELLEPYGGLGAIPRRLQVSNWYLNNELSQLQGFGFMLPMIFLGVAAFLLNVVLGRIISVQREQIAALKALGYGNADIGWHYTQWSLLIAGLGGVFGLALGYRLGLGMIHLYNDYFRFPFLEYQLTPEVVVSAVSISLMAGIVGSMGSVRAAVKLPPAEAMRPEAPARYRRTWVERLGLESLLSPAARMVLRNLERRPLRFLASVVGVACSGSLLILGLFFGDSIQLLLETQFYVIQRQDITVSFVQARGAGSRHEIERLPGVISVEPARNVAVRLRAGHRSRQTAVTGLVQDPRLQRVVDVDSQVAPLPLDGLLMSSKLAEVLSVERGDRLMLEVLEGHRPQREVRVADVVEEYMGTQVYMDIDSLRRLLREGEVLSGAYLRVDPRYEQALYDRLKTLPVVAGVALKSAQVDSFNAQMDQMMGVFISFSILFASIITIGVVYNAARVILSERRRELASLRVLGFTRAEISAILLGELALVTVAAIPLGLLFGYGLAGAMVTGFDTELYRFPLEISVRTYATSALVVATASAVAGLSVRRRLDHLDLVEVLKTRD